MWEQLGEISEQTQILHDLGIDLRAIIIQIAVLIIMYSFIKKVFFTPLRQALDDRSRYLENTYADAENLKTEMERIRGEYEQKLAEAEAESRAQIQGAIAEAQRLKEQLTGEARQQAEDIVKRGTEDVARERAHAMLEIRSHVVDLALNAAERLTKETLDDEKHRKLVASFVEEAGVA